MARVAHRASVQLDIREEQIADEAHVGGADQRVLRAVRDHLRQLQRFPRTGEPVHRHHRDVRRRVDRALGQPVVDVAQREQRLLVKLRRGLGQQALDLADRAAHRQQQRHLARIRHRGVAFKRHARAGTVVRDRVSNRVRGQGPERGRAHERIVEAPPDDQHARLGLIGGTCLGQQRAHQPSPHRRDAVARDAAFEFLFRALGADQILERAAEQAQRRRRALDVVQHRPQRAEDEFVRQHRPAREAVDLHGLGQAHRRRLRQPTQESPQKRRLLRRKHR